MTGFATRDDGTITAVETSAGRDRGRRAGRRRARALGGAVLGAARPAGHDRRPHAVRRRRPRPADVDVLEPPGGRDRDRPADVRDRRRRRAARDPPRHRRAALHRRRRARDGRALGHLLQARPPRRAGRRVAARRRRRRRARPVPVDDRRRLELPGHVVRGALALDERASRAAARCTSTARSGGVGAFTADNFPVFDYFRPNVYAIFDSNHGYKMIGVGKRGRRRARSASTRASSTRSASSASRPATCTRSRARRIPGPSSGDRLASVDRPEPARRAMASSSSARRA